LYDVPLDNGERALFAGQLVSNVETKWGVRPKLLWLMGYGSDGLQPDVPSGIRTRGAKSLQHLHVFFERLADELEKKKHAYKFVCPQHGKVIEEGHKRFRLLSEVYK